jgi:hypothetical protein
LPAGQGQAAPHHDRLRRRGHTERKNLAEQPFEEENEPIHFKKAESLTESVKGVIGPVMKDIL